MHEFVILCNLNAVCPERFGLESRLQELGMEYRTSIIVKHGRYSGSQEIIKFEVSIENKHLAQQELQKIYTRNYKDLENINWKMLLFVIVFLGLLSTNYCGRSSKKYFNSVLPGINK